MFEICHRHSPVFAMSEVAKLTTVLDLGQISFEALEIRDICQTVRINEENTFVLTGTTDIAAAINILQKSAMLRDLRNNRDLIDDVIVRISEKFALDSYVSVGGEKVEIALDKKLRRADSNSKKPLVVFRSNTPIDYERLESNWLTSDHPALWLGQVSVPLMQDTEAFFAITPAFQLEVALNRYVFLEKIADFAIGMVKF